MRSKLKRLIYMAPAAILGILLFCAIGGAIVMLLWNWLLPPLFAFHEITFWQALGLLALGRILFGGSGWHRAGHSNFRRRMAERWERMTPEERERLRQSWRGRCGFEPSGSESTGE